MESALLGHAIAGAEGKLYSKLEINLAIDVGWLFVLGLTAKTLLFYHIEKKRYIMIEVPWQQNLGTVSEIT